MIFQEVVHSIGTREADCDEQSSFRGQDRMDIHQNARLTLRSREALVEFVSGGLGFSRGAASFQGHSQNRGQVGSPLSTGRREPDCATAPRVRIAVPEPLRRAGWSWSSNSAVSSVRPIRIARSTGLSG